MSRFPSMKTEVPEMSPTAADGGHVDDLQEQLLASENLSQLRANWIHDIISAVNPLAGALQAIRNRTDSLPCEYKHYVIEAVADAETGLRFLRDVQTDIRRLTLGVSCPPCSVSLADAVDSATRLFGLCSDSRIQVVRDIELGARVYAEHGKLLRVLVNLLNNAAGALATKTFVEEPPTIWLVASARLGHTRLIVRDNGPGILPEIQERIFDRFFSTKPQGAGSGLGLYICRTFIESWAGTISVRSVPGHFCEFVLEFLSAA